MCSAVGCGGHIGDPTFVPSTVVIDNEVVGFDYSAPIGLSAGVEGSLFFDKGWSPQSPAGDTGVFTRWAMDGRSEFFFPGPPTSSSIYVRCRALSWNGSPTQTMAVTVNDVEVWAGALGPVFEEFMIPIPNSALSHGLNKARFDFAFARRPADVGINQDERRLSALFTALAIVPRETPLPMQLSDGPRMESAGEETARIQVPLGAAITIPVAPDSRLRFRLGEVEGCSETCSVVADVLTRDSNPRTIGRVRVAKAAGAALDFASPAGAPSRLRLSFFDEGPRDVLAKHTVTLSLTLDSLGRKRPDQNGNRGKPPHVFVYLVDTLRHDAVGDVVRGVEMSPNIDAFARDAVRYVRAWAPSTWTLPSVVSTLTGTYPPTHGIMRGDTKFSLENVPGIAGVLSQHGYHSVGISQSFISSDRFGVDTGFDDFFLENYLNSRELGSSRIRRILTEWLVHEYQPAKSIFAFIHTVDPHAPYSHDQLTNHPFASIFPGALPDTSYSPLNFMLDGRSGEAREVSHLWARYQDEVVYADQQFGRFIALLNALDLYDGSVVILLSDHGEEFAEHGGFDHGRTVYEELVHIPLYIKFPEFRWAGTDVTERVSGVDLVPTLLELGGVDASGFSFDGESLVALGEGRLSQPRTSVYAEVSPVAGEHRSEVDYKTAVVGDIKCIFSGNLVNQFSEPIPEWRIFDLSADPGELAPLEVPGEHGAECVDIVRRFSETLDDRSRREAEGIDEVDREKLRALGYIR